MNRSRLLTERFSKILGHRDNKTAIEHLRLKIDEMSDAMRIYAQ